LPGGVRTRYVKRPLLGALNNPGYLCHLRWRMYLSHPGPGFHRYCMYVSSKCRGGLHNTRLLKKKYVTGPGAPCRKPPACGTWPHRGKPGMKIFRRAGRFICLKRPVTV